MWGNPSFFYSHLLKCQILVFSKKMFHSKTVELLLRLPRLWRPLQLVSLRQLQIRTRVASDIFTVFTLSTLLPYHQARQGHEFVIHNLIIPYFFSHICRGSDEHIFPILLLLVVTRFARSLSFDLSLSWISQYLMDNCMSWTCEIFPLSPF